MPVSLISNGDSGLTIRTKANAGLSAVNDLEDAVDLKQPLAEALTEIAGLTPGDGDLMRFSSGMWAAITLAALKTALAIVKADVGLGNVDNTSDATKNSASATLTNKQIDALTNTITNLRTYMFESNVFDNDPTLSANSSTRIPSQSAVKGYADSLIAAADAMRFMGLIDASSNPNYPAANRGDAYVISNSGKVGGASGAVVEAGDLLICKYDGQISGNEASVGANWAIIERNRDGLVTGPASAAAGRFARFQGTTGKAIEDAGPLVLADVTDASANGRALVGAANYAAMRALLDLEAGTDFNAYSSNLAAFAGLSLIADRLIYANGTGTLALAPFTGQARNLLDDATAGDMQTTLGGTAVGKAVFTAADAAAGRAALGAPYYEEGTFTPTYSATITPPTGVAYSVQTGRYTRTGRKWLFEGRMIVSNVGTGGAGVAFMGGLPVAAGQISFTTCLRSTGATIPSGGVIAGLLDSNRMYLQYQTNGGPVDLSLADIPSSFDVIFSFQITT